MTTPPDAPALPDDAFDWPAFGLQDDVRPAMASALARGEPCALATLYAVEGGAPRGVGAQMLYAGGALSGFLSGGCVEADVALHAQGVLAEGRPRRLVYGEGGPPDVRLACGSRIEVLVEAIAPDDPAARALVELAAARRPALWLTDGEARASFEPGSSPEGLPAPLRPLAEARGFCGARREPFAVFRRHAPPLRLVVVGSDPIALAVLKFAAVMGVEAVLVRPKGPEQAPETPLSAYLRADGGAALQSLRPDPWTAIALLSHDAELEHETLKAALAGDAGYIGALGSRRRIPERNARLRAAGLGEDDLARIRAPIGLPIGGKSPWEIAVSVLAEIVANMADEAGRRA
jgi:xanthine dehydrogenase accessory factor